MSFIHHIVFLNFLNRIEYSPQNVGNTYYRDEGVSHEPIRGESPADRVHGKGLRVSDEFPEQQEQCGWGGVSRDSWERRSDFAGPCSLHENEHQCILHRITLST